MESQLILKSLEFDEAQENILSVVLQDKKSLQKKRWPISFELMDLSMQHHLFIETDPLAKILVYTKKYDMGICPTIKVFHPGDQKNLLFDKLYRSQHGLDS